MSPLRHQIGSDASGIAVCADDDGFGWSRQKFNGAIEGHEFFGSGHVPVSRADDLVHARNTFGSIGQGSDGLCTAHSIQLAHAEECSGRQGYLSGARRCNANPFDTGDLRWNHRHEHCRGQGIAAARHIASDRLQRTQQLADADTGLDLATPLVILVLILVLGLGRLPLRIAANIGRSLLDRGLQLRISSLPSLAQFVLRYTKRLVPAQSVPAHSIAVHSTIAVTTDLIYDAAYRGLDSRQIGRTAPGQHSHQPISLCAFENAYGDVALHRIARRIAHRFFPHCFFSCHITTLLSGYSTMP